VSLGSVSRASAERTYGLYSQSSKCAHLPSPPPWCRISALPHCIKGTEPRHKGAAINVYSVSMGDLKPLNFTLGARWPLILIAALVWAIGGAFDGHGLRALIAVPALVGAWVCATIVLDRSVRMRHERL
jgi:hypothetical protein